MKYCLDCGKTIYKKSTRCKSCSQKGRTRVFTEEHKHRIHLAKTGKHNGINNPNWKGGRSFGGEKARYINIYSPNHPFKNKDNYVLEHRVVMETHMGRILLPNEVVHHINGNTSDNRVENLMLFSCQSDHFKFHHKLKTQ